MSVAVCDFLVSITSVTPRSPVCYSEGGRCYKCHNFYTDARYTVSSLDCYLLVTCHLEALLNGSLALPRMFRPVEVGYAQIGMILKCLWNAESTAASSTSSLGNADFVEATNSQTNVWYSRFSHWYNRPRVRELQH
jgi:hypothetical protein